MKLFSQTNTGLHARYYNLFPLKSRPVPQHTQNINSTDLSNYYSPIYGIRLGYTEHTSAYTFKEFFASMQHAEISEGEFDFGRTQTFEGTQFSIGIEHRYYSGNTRFVSAYFPMSIGAGLGSLTDKANNTSTRVFVLVNANVGAGLSIPVSKFYILSDFRVAVLYDGRYQLGALLSIGTIYTF